MTALRRGSGAGGSAPGCPRARAGVGVQARAGHSAHPGQHAASPRGARRAALARMSAEGSDVRAGFVVTLVPPGTSTAPMEHPCVSRPRQQKRTCPD